MIMENQESPILIQSLSPSAVKIRTDPNQYQPHLGDNQHGFSSFPVSFEHISTPGALKWKDDEQE